MIVSFYSIGWYDWLLILSAMVIIAIAVARLNDIDRSKNSKRWWMRRVGLLMVFVSMVMFVGAYFTIAAPYWEPMRKFLMFYGFMISWITTPGQPPFWKYISRHDSKE